MEPPAQGDTSSLMCSVYLEHKQGLTGELQPKHCWGNCTRSPKNVGRALLVSLLHGHCIDCTIGLPLQPTRKIVNNQ